MNATQKIVIALIAFAIVSVAIFAAVNTRPLTNSTSLATDKRNLVVVTSIAPIANIIENIGGEKVDIIKIVPDRIDSYTFRPSVTDSVIIKTRADLVIINGLNLETTIEDAARQSENPNLRILELADNTINAEQWIFDHSFPKENGFPNPHLWLDVGFAIKYVELVRDELSTADPQNAEYYDSNAELYLERLKLLDEAIMQSVQTIPEENRKLVTYHDSLPYFAKRYGLEVITALQPAHFGEPTDEEIAGIIAQIKAENVPAVFASEVFSNDVTQRIADEAEVQVVRTLRDDTLPGNIGASQHTYPGMMVANVRTMVTALGGDATLLEEYDPSDTYQMQ